MNATRQIPLKFKTAPAARQMDFHLNLAGGAQVSRVTAGAVAKSPLKNTGSALAQYEAGPVVYSGISSRVTVGKWLVGRAIARRVAGDRLGMRIIAKEFAYVSGGAK
jgi:hypothetical protein